MALTSKVLFGLFVISLLMLSEVRGEGDQESNNSEDKDDLETAEFLFWPKLFFYKGAATKTVAVKTVPVEYTYKPVTYTAYKWVPVPYEVTVQQPVIQKTVSVPAVSVVKAPFVTVGVVKSPVTSVSAGVSVSSDASTTD